MSVDRSRSVPGILDGTDTCGDAEVITATNRIESLNPALIRPGRIDSKIEFPLTDVEIERRILNKDVRPGCAKPPAAASYLARAQATPLWNPRMLYTNMWPPETRQITSNTFRAAQKASFKNSQNCQILQFR
ncbi:hypothetical protein DFH11DRAFT_1747333 [Phellopilus nigrolimitatus]|nr:hypothetical protein DFH11DRAFT_1747333 [Phellopilus nigrolimitatus]